MDERTLNELLECSVCLDRLDSSSKVLPCQHTFCRRCLEEIVSTKHELRCPECRSLVEIKVEDLPSNILLIRLLEGMKTSGGASCSSGYNSPTSPSHKLQTGAGQTVRHNSNNKLSSIQQPCAKALYNYDAKEPGDLSFKKGDRVLLRKQVDENWYHGELNGQYGFFPATYVQVLTALPPQEVPKCTALYDFIIDDENEKDCLTFHKDEVVTVIRRIDEHWAEGKLGERIGIFPISFVDLNDSAKWLINNQPIPNLISSHRGSNQLSNSSSNAQGTSPKHVEVPNNLPRQSLPSVSGNNSTVNNATVSNNHRSEIGNNDLCNNVPSSTTVMQNSKNSNHIRTTVGILVTTASSVSSVSTGILLSSSNQIHGTTNSTAVSASSSSHQAKLAAAGPLRSSSSLLSASSSSSRQQQKRHSFTSIGQPSLSLLNAHQRHSLELTGNEVLTATSTPSSSSSSTNSPSSETGIVTSVSETSATSVVPCSATTTTTSTCTDTAVSAIGATGSVTTVTGAGDAVGTARSRPATSGIFIALYNYKPQKNDEVELTKGAYYMVSEKCQDGWYKGTCLRSGVSGVFPGNYVQMVRLPASMKTSAQYRAAVLTPTTQATSVSSTVQPSTPQNVVGSNISALTPFEVKNRSSVNRTHSFPKTSPHHLGSEVHGRSSSQGMVIKAPSRTITNVTQALSRCITSSALSAPSSTSKLAQNTQTGAILSSSTHTTQSQHSSASLLSLTTSTSTSAPERSHVCANPGASTHSPKPSHRHHHTHYHRYHHHHAAAAKLSSGSASSSPRTLSMSHSIADATARSSPDTTKSLENSTNIQHSISSVKPVLSSSSKVLVTSTGVSKPTSAVSKAVTRTTMSSSGTTSAAACLDKHEKQGKERKERKDRESILKRLASAGIPLKGRKSKSPPPPDVTERKEHKHSNHHRSGSEGSILEGPAAAAIAPSTSAPNTSSHKKSADKPGKVKPLVRDRYRCTVPYPPQSENELELKVGDVVYVHKKREDGWLKGTLQRTGKTGIFPCIFVNRF